MARKYVALVSLIGRLVGTYELIVEAVEEQGGTFNHLDSFVSRPVNRRKLAKLVMGTLELAKPNQYPVSVDYSMTVKQMVEVGLYDWKNKDIQDNFQVSGEGKVSTELELVHLNKPVSTRGAEAYLEANGLRPATLAELLAFGATYPDIHREFSVVALGSSWVSPCGDREVPCLKKDTSLRGLDLYLSDRKWGKGFRFLAVRK